MSQFGTEPIRITTTPEQAVEFLRKLAGDDDFRRRYEADARALLAEYGVEIPEGSLPEPVVAPPAIALEPVVAALELAIAGEGDGDGDGFSFLWGFVFFSFFGPHSFIGLADSFRGLKPDDE
jgi:hypothetical protein